MDSKSLINMTPVKQRRVEPLLGLVIYGFERFIRITADDLRFDPKRPKNFQPNGFV